MNMRWKRNWPLVAIFLWVVVFMTLFLGSERVVAYTSSTTRSSTTSTTTAVEGKNYENSLELFDARQVHQVQVKMDEDTYQQMISTYQNTGEKEYFQADVVIDGVEIKNVGIRLKGNASLRTALGGGGARVGPMAQDGNAKPVNRGGPAGQQVPPAGMPQGGFPGGRQMPQDGAPMPPMGGDGQAPAQAQDATKIKIPFMIKFDEYVEGQTYQGYTAIAIRNYGVNYDAAMLAEPVTNDMARLVGLPATKTSYAGFRLNDEAEKLYVISEVVNKGYVAEYFDNPNGVLYKAELGSSLSYQGEDPSSYARSFTQQTRVNDADMAPLIAFSRFLSEADDGTFEQELATYLDVDAFATYLALSNLLVNIDSIAGMNNNYYLYYDDQAQRFTLLMWDTNESLGGLGVRMGDGNVASYDLYYAGGQAMRMPGGGEQNILVKRFLNSDIFRALYEEKLKKVYEKVFVSGAIDADIEQYASLIQAANVDERYESTTAYNLAVQTVRDFVAQRRAYLQSTQLLGQP